MTDEDSEQLPVIDSWDTYWAGAQSSAAFSGGGTTDPLVLGFWDDFFRDLHGRSSELRIIDIASGNGAVVESASKAFKPGLPSFTCLDVSESAIRMLEERFPDVQGVVADAAKPPFPNESFDVVTSQYGVEYAGPEAVMAAARLVSRRGSLALLLHHRDGLIFRQCSASLSAIREMQAAEFIPRCIAMFEAAYAVLNGGDKRAYQAAGRQFAPAISAMERIMARHGRDVAADTIVRIYRDVRTIHGRLQHYEASAVIAWLTNMREAIEAYKGRMASMLDVAIDTERFTTIVDELRANGFSIERSEPLAHAPGSTPLAWALIAQRR